MTPRLISSVLVSCAAALASACAAVPEATSPAPVAAAPTATAATSDSERAPLDLRRTTLVVSNIERSLEFYRDALGMTPIYDTYIRTPRSAETREDADRELRLVFLKANSDYVGVLGLMEYTKPVKAADPQDKTPFQPGDIVLVFNMDDAVGAYERAIAVEGAEGRGAPEETSYPSYDGESVIRVLVSVVLDPDGHAIELNQLLDTLR